MARIKSEDAEKDLKLTTLKASGGEREIEGSKDEGEDIELLENT